MEYSRSPSRSDDPLESQIKQRCFRDANDHRKVNANAFGALLPHLIKRKLSPCFSILN